VLAARLRVRETHLRDHLAPLLSRGASGAVKLDLALRALTADSVGTSAPGVLDGALTWEDLHDVVRPAAYYADEVALKRKWVSDKLRILERLNLIRRRRQSGTRPRLSVLCDDGGGQPLDDPALEAGQSYTTVLGSIFTSQRIANWGSSEMSAVFAAMIAERYARADPEMTYLVRRLPVGGGAWSHPLSWFSDRAQERPAHHVRVPFSPRTLRRGITALEGEGLVVARWISRNPRTGRAYANRLPRRLYVNGFDALEVGGRTADRRVPGILAAIAMRERDATSEE
jgi:hypothetical protein